MKTKQAADKSGALSIEPAYRQALGVRTAPAQMQEFGKAIHAFGSIVRQHEKGIYGGRAQKRAGFPT
jgi:hypothetical protein